MHLFRIYPTEPRVAELEVLIPHEYFVESAILKTYFKIQNICAAGHAIFEVSHKIQSLLSCKQIRANKIKKNRLRHTYFY